MEQDGVKTGEEPVLRGRGAGVGHHLHIVYGHGADAGAVGVDRFARPVKPAFVVLGLGFLAGVGQLHAGNRVVLVDSRGDFRPLGQEFKIHDRAGGVAASVAHGALAKVDDGRAAARLVLDVADIVVVRLAACRSEKHIRGRHDPVFQRQLPHLQRFEQVGVRLSVHETSLPCKKAAQGRTA